MKKTILKTFSKLTFADNRFCYDIEESKKDIFTGEKKFSSPRKEEIQFTKVVSQEGAITYDLRPHVDDSFYTDKGYGLHILFKDGSKFSKPDQTIFGRRGYNGMSGYSAYVTITEEELKIFSEKLITDIRLDIFDRKISKKSAIKFREYAKCLLK